MKRLAQSNPDLQTPASRTPHYYGQFALSLGKESPYIFSKFNPLNTDTFYGPLSVCINGGLTVTSSLYASCHFCHFGINPNLYLKPKIKLIS